MRRCLPVGYQRRQSVNENMETGEDESLSRSGLQPVLGEATRGGYGDQPLPCSAMTSSTDNLSHDASRPNHLHPAVVP